jgi:phage shock protein C
MGKKLYRETKDRVLGGVAAGLARYLEIDVTWVRILFILVTIFGGSGFLAYLVLWIAIPEQPFNWTMNGDTDYRVDKPETVISEAAQPKKSSSMFVGGLILIFLGLFFLLHEFDLIPYWFSLGKLWPLVFVVPGLVMLMNARDKASSDTPKDDQASSGESDSSSIH